MNKYKIAQLKSLINNDLAGFVFFAEKPIINDDTPKDDDLYYCIVNGRKINKTLRELRRTKAIIWDEKKSYPQ